MNLSQRQKLSVTLLVLYWPTIFVITHIPIPRMVTQSQVSDKAIHFIAYLALIFLWWFAVSPYKKVRWGKALVWWTLVVMVWYSATDEWLQSIVGRNADVYDFFANLAGALSGLVLLSIFSFWSGSVIVSAVIIFSITTMTRTNLAELIPTSYAVFHLLAYAFFSLLWVQFLKRKYSALNPLQLKWVSIASVLPLTLLVFLTAISILRRRPIGSIDMIVAVIGIATIIAASYFAALRRRKFSKAVQ